MNVQRGDVVLVDYPYAAGGGTKVWPVLVVQNDRDNQRLLNTIVAQITSVTRRALEPTQLLIEIATPAGQQSGLRPNSVVNCVNYSRWTEARFSGSWGAYRMPSCNRSITV
jgi:mRNA interferase MazF